MLTQRDISIIDQHPPDTLTNPVTNPTKSTAALNVISVVLCGCGCLVMKSACYTVGETLKRCYGFH